MDRERAYLEPVGCSHEAPVVLNEDVRDDNLCCPLRTGTAVTRTRWPLGEVQEMMQCLTGGHNKRRTTRKA